ncbi:MAG: hypothetical protein LKI39_10670 [Bacteroides sp.]|nr:hypothetical protein [Bacteroides sp.]MCI1683007.1 hypothetical protein [Bacteroides sp.]
MLNSVKRNRVKIRIAWLLLLTLMPISVVKITHHHNDSIQSSCHGTCGQNNNSQDSCPICQFVLSPFVPSTTISVSFIAELIALEPVVYVNKDVLSDTPYSYGLRAPPCIA